MDQPDAEKSRLEAMAEDNAKPSPKVTGILVCKDLFFTAGVTATARELGLSVKVCPGLGGLESMLSQWPDAKAVIVDMGLLEASDAPAWSKLRELAAPPIILAGFGSHVDVNRFEAAQVAGFDHVLAKSAFSGRMVEWLKAWL